MCESEHQGGFCTNVVFSYNNNDDCSFREKLKSLQLDEPELCVCSIALASIDNSKPPVSLNTAQ